MVSGSHSGLELSVAGRPPDEFPAVFLLREIRGHLSHLHNVRLSLSQSAGQLGQREDEAAEAGRGRGEVGPATFWSDQARLQSQQCLSSAVGTLIRTMRHKITIKSKDTPLHQTYRQTTYTEF